MAGVLTTIADLSRYNNDKPNQVKLPPAEDGTRTYDINTGVTTSHATPEIAFSSETETTKVVTERVDMWGFEAFLREISHDDPFVYANGIIQSLAMNISGVPTSVDTVRPDSYFSWYEGDLASKGKGVNWYTVSPANKVKIAKDPKNNIYFDDSDGKFYQWCIRGRSFSGTGNGDWKHINGPLLAYSISNPVLRVRAQGVLDSAPELGSGAPYYYNNRHEIASELVSGIFQSKNTDGLKPALSSGGDAYFMVCGTVNRLNKGAYHPSFNPLGAARFKNTSNEGGNPWFSSSITRPTQASMCFTSAVSGGAGKEPSPSSGSIFASSDAYSGRPDQKVYDAIYASGQGGVCRDMRYSAWGLKARDFYTTDLKVKSGEYRGREKLKRVKYIQSGLKITRVGSPSGYIYLWQDNEGVPSPSWFVSGDYKNGRLYTIEDSTMDIVRIDDFYQLYESGVDNGSWAVRLLDTAYSASTSLESNSRYSYHVVFEDEVDCSLSSSYQAIEVFGEPKIIAECPDLKNGWVGTWNPREPNGNLRYALNKKALKGYAAQFTTDKGMTWQSTSSAYNLETVKNDVGHPLFAKGSVIVLNYLTKARMLENSSNMPILPPFDGLGRVFVNTNHEVKEGALLSYSLTQRVTTDSTHSNLQNSALNMKDYSLTTSGAMKLKLFAPWSNCKHESLSLSAPLNDSRGTKSLSYATKIDLQGFINYAYSEIKYTGTDWGDDSKIAAIDNQSKRLDDNGEIVVSGTARIVEPIGWIKNDK